MSWEELTFGFRERERERSEKVKAEQRRTEVWSGIGSTRRYKKKKLEIDAHSSLHPQNVKSPRQGRNRDPLN